MPTITTPLIQVSEDVPGYAGVYYTAFVIPESEVHELLQREKNPSRIEVNINGQGSIFSGMMPDGQGNFFITVSKEVRKRFQLEEGEEAELVITPDDSDYGMPVPEEVVELWAVDEDAQRVFHLLTPGKQRSLLYLIAKPKGADTRVKKCIQIHEYLKSVNGKLDYKDMNAYMKADNVNW